MIQLTDFIAQNYTMLVVIAGTMFLGLASGAIGTISTLRKQALIGDALSHATLPGVVLAFILVGHKSISILLLGAFVSSIFAMMLLTLIKKYSKIKIDAIMALILSSFFGIGQVFLVYVQRTGDAAQAGLNKFIFGQAATMITVDAIIVSIVAFFVLAMIFLFWKAIKLYIFNQEHYQSLGFSPKLMNTLLSILVVIVVVIGIRMVGVILMSALLIIPGVASRQWSNKLSVNVSLAAFFGMISGLFGTYFSANQANLPTGPVVVLFLSVIMIVSLFFAPKRGLLFQSIRQKEYRKKLIKYKPLIHLYAQNPADMLKESDLTELKKQSLISSQENKVIITPLGLSLVRTLLGGDVK